jgi:hypothetical protein
MHALTAAALWLLAQAPAPVASDLLTAADAAYRDGDFDTASADYHSALDTGGLPRELTVRAYAGAALSDAVRLDADRAAAAFERLLTLEPNWRLPENVGPKVREPFARAQKVAQQHGALRVEVTPPGPATMGLPFDVKAASADPLSMVSTLRLVWGTATSTELTVPGSDVQPGLTVHVEALDAHGSVIAETAALHVDVQLPANAVVREPLFHVGAAASVGLGDLRAGAEAEATIRIIHALEAGVGVLIGQHLGVQVLANAIARGDGRLGLFLQPRVSFTPVPEGFVFGFGAATGVHVELGPGRIVLAVAGEGYVAPAPYAPFAAFALAGYELGFLRL